MAIEELRQSFRRRIPLAVIVRSYLAVILVIIAFLASIGIIVLLERLLLEWIR